LKHLRCPSQNLKLRALYVQLEKINGWNVMFGRPSIDRCGGESTLSNWIKYVSCQKLLLTVLKLPPIRKFDVLRIDGTSPIRFVSIDSDLARRTPERGSVIVMWQPAIDGIVVELCTLLLVDLETVENEALIAYSSPPRIASTS
jgi:hypothetical protein